MDKKLEKEILKMVYNESHFKSIVDSERPDFKLVHDASTPPFGVEITELYLNESFARLKNINTYRSELIEDEKYRHKDDKDTFDVGMLEIYDSDNSTKFKEIGLIADGTSHEDYISAITNTIKNKDNKLKKYQKGLNHINLTFFDQSNHLSSIEAEDFFKYFYHPPIRKKLLATGFREIFFITIVEDSRRVFYPLKMLLFIAEFYFFGEFFGMQKNELPINSLNEQIQLFAELMRAKGAESFILKNKNKNDEIIWGNYSITLDEKRSVVLHNYYDNPTPLEKQFPDFDKNKSIINSPFVENFDKYTEERVINSLFSDVNNSLS